MGRRGPKPLTNRQWLVLRAAYDVDYVPLQQFRGSNIKFSVFRALVHRRLLRQRQEGWEITTKGRERIERRIP